MDSSYIDKVKKLHDAVINCIPQNVDYTARNGYFTINVNVVTSMSTHFSNYRELTFKGQLRKDLISVSLWSGGYEQVMTTLLPYVAPMGDKTPIYKILQASILFAFGTMPWRELNLKIKRIPNSELPWESQSIEEAENRGKLFMKRLMSEMRKSNCLYTYKTIPMHCTAAKLKQAISLCCFEDDDKRKKINDTLTRFSSVIPSKDQAEDMVPDLFFANVYSSSDFSDGKIIMLAADPKSKEKFWWQYFKMNLFLSCHEYDSAVCILSGKWRRPTMKKWISEYRANGMFESERAKKYLSFYLRSSLRTPSKILTCDMQVFKFRTSYK